MRHRTKILLGIVFWVLVISWTTSKAEEQSESDVIWDICDLPDDPADPVYIPECDGPRYELLYEYWGAGAWITRLYPRTFANLQDCIHMGRLWVKQRNHTYSRYNCVTQEGEANGKERNR